MIGVEPTLPKKTDPKSVAAPHSLRNHVLSVACLPFHHLGNGGGLGNSTLDSAVQVQRFSTKLIPHSINYKIIFKLVNYFLNV